jgi:hypothetical protein
VVGRLTPQEALLTISRTSPLERRSGAAAAHQGGKMAAKKKASKSKPAAKRKTAKKKTSARGRKK